VPISGAEDAILGLQVYTLNKIITYESDIARNCDLRSSDGKQSSLELLGLLEACLDGTDAASAAERSPMA